MNPIEVPVFPVGGGRPPVLFDHVSFRYRRGRGVFDGLTLELPAGTTLLLGPNGAGKSTLLRLAAGSLAPSRGGVVVADLSPGDRAGRRAYQRTVSWLPQEVSPVVGLTVREQVAYAGWLKGMGKSEAWTHAAQALDRVGLGDRADERVGALSGGQRRRVGIAQALVHRARVVLLDEPTAGLDPAQRVEFRRVLTDLAADASVIVSTHQTEDVDELYDHVVVLDEGQVRFDGSTAAFLGDGPERSAERVVSAYQRVMAA